MKRRLFLASAALLSPLAAMATSGSATMATAGIFGAWQFDVPVNWKAPAGGDQGYLESSDGSVGCYIQSIVPPETAGTAAELAAAILAIHESSMRTAMKRDWKVASKASQSAGGYCRARVDLFDQASKYRIVSFVLASPSDALQVTVHNYYCEDYSANRDAYRGTELSLRRSAKKA